MKALLKIAFCLFVGCLIGMLVVQVVLAIAGEIAWSDMFSSLLENDNLLVPIAITAAIIIFGFLQIIIHESGHLVCGLASGFKFVSFRIGSLTLIRQDGKLKLRRFSIAGTGGQCLLSPPDKNDEQINLFWYNIGGVLANVIVSLIAVAAMFAVGKQIPNVSFALGLFAFIGLFLALINGIPFGINDGNTTRTSQKDAITKRMTIALLRINAAVTQGTSIIDLPEEWMLNDLKADYKIPIQANFELMRLSRITDFETLHNRLKDILDNHVSDLPPVLQFETKCEFAFTSMATGRIDEAKATLSKQLMNYVKAYQKSMSSKQCLMFAIELILNKNKDAAIDILKSVEQNRHQYLMQGEVGYDIDRMHLILEQNS